MFEKIIKKNKKIVDRLGKKINDLKADNDFISPKELYEYRKALDDIETYKWMERLFK